MARRITLALAGLLSTMALLAPGAASAAVQSTSVNPGTEFWSTELHRKHVSSGGELVVPITVTAGHECGAGRVTEVSVYHELGFPDGDWGHPINGTSGYGEGGSVTLSATAVFGFTENLPQRFTVREYCAIENPSTTYSYVPFSYRPIWICIDTAPGFGYIEKRGLDADTNLANYPNAFDCDTKKPVKSLPLPDRSGQGGGALPQPDIIPCNPLRPTQAPNCTQAGIDPNRSLLAQLGDLTVEVVDALFLADLRSLLDPNVSELDKAWIIASYLVPVPGGFIVGKLGKLLVKKLGPVFPKLVQKAQALLVKGGLPVLKKTQKQLQREANQQMAKLAHPNLKKALHADPKNVKKGFQSHSVQGGPKKPRPDRELWSPNGYVEKGAQERAMKAAESVIAHPKAELKLLKPDGTPKLLNGRPVADLRLPPGYGINAQGKVVKVKMYNGKPFNEKNYKEGIGIRFDLETGKFAGFLAP